MKLVVLGVVLVASEARADLRFAVANDVFTDANPPMDDDGFTNDLELAFWRPIREYTLGGRVVHRWITEEVSLVSMGRRRDLVEVLATGERAWLAGPFDVGAGARVGPALTGNLGGRWMQDGWHRLCDCGTLLEDGLQSRYEGETAVGLVTGGRGRVTTGTWPARAYAHLDGQLALGAGVSSLEAALGGEVTHRRGRVVLGARAELAAMRFEVADDRLALPGSYGTGWQGAWRAGGYVAYRRVRVDYEYRANEGGSGEPIAVIAFTFKQAGTSY